MSRQRSTLFTPGGDPSQVLARALLLMPGLVVLLWFLYQTLRVLLLFILPIILALALTAPVTWLERQELGRGLATLIVFAALAAVLERSAGSFSPDCSSRWRAPSRHTSTSSISPGSRRTRKWRSGWRG